MTTDREVSESVQHDNGTCACRTVLQLCPVHREPFATRLRCDRHFGICSPFADTTDFVPNCALHEYLRRLDSTTAAVQSLQVYLADIEARTGRPFVLLVFGDHQPHTFSSTGGFQYDYSRLPADHRHAHDVLPHHFVRAGKEAACCTVMPPTTLLPTLLSGYVADSPDDVYLGLNLWLHAHCGTDAVHRDFGNFMSKLSPGPLRNARTLAICV